MGFNKMDVFSTTNALLPFKCNLAFSYIVFFTEQSGCPIIPSLESLLKLTDREYQVTHFSNVTTKHFTNEMIPGLREYKKKPTTPVPNKSALLYHTHSV